MTLFKEDLQRHPQNLLSEGRMSDVSLLIYKSAFNCETLRLQPIVYLRNIDKSVEKYLISNI